MPFLGRMFTKSKSDGSGMVGPKAPAMPQAGAAPTPGDAKAKAKEEMDRRKRLAALSGGKTILTSAGTPAGTSGKTLLGA